MQLSSLFVAVVAAVGAFAQAPDPAINTPSGVQQCLATQLTFSGTSPPFIITVVPAGQAGAAPLTTVGTTSANAITWVANLPLGDYTLVIRDSLGRTNPSGEPSFLSCRRRELSPVVMCHVMFDVHHDRGFPSHFYGTFSILPGIDATCVGAAASSAPAASSPAAATSAPASSPAAATSAPAATSPAASSPASAAANTSKPASASVVSSASAAAATTSKNAASGLQPLGIAGLLGVAGVAALF
ncbi:hypothetical protein FRC01_012031 [Tulasnella sp. 417]|nr:hypothetical protein FRC01_012031 [Tulasnella sp. 417]